MTIIPCLVALLTFTCADDKLYWDSTPPAGATNIQVQAFEFNGGIGPLVWETTKQLGAKSHPVGCGGPWWVCVSFVDAQGVRVDTPSCMAWETGNMRMLDDTNGPASRWVGERMCGVTP